tara:strand:- start:280 stop:381 length:102 start_codon:yes stop_codon:yes gene_type:complete
LGDLPSDIGAYEMVSNNAVAVVITPLAISIAIN